MNTPILAHDCPLIKLRSLGPNLKVAREKALKDPNLVILTPTIATSKKEFAELKPWQQYEVRVMAVAQATTKAILCGIAAATALGIACLKPAQHDKRIELGLAGVTSPSGKSLWSTQTRYLYTNLPKGHHCLYNDLRVTTIPRTYIDLLQLYGPRVALAFAEAAMYQKKIRKPRFIKMVASLGDSRQVYKALALLKIAHDNIQSVYETLARYQLLTSNIRGITSMVPQAVLPDKGRRYVPDLLINGWLIVEIDGDSKYENDPVEVIWKERVRERELLRRGYGILRIRARQVEEDIVSEVSAYLHNAHRVQALAA